MNKTLSIYLDVHGTLVRNNTPEACLHEFITYITSTYDCYWLTSLAKDGQIDNIQNYLLLAGVSTETLELMFKHVKPTKWHNNKSEAIDLDKPFLWFDDAPLATDIYILREKQLTDSLFQIDPQTEKTICTWLKGSQFNRPPDSNF